MLFRSGSAGTASGQAGALKPSSKAVGSGVKEAEQLQGSITDPGWKMTAPLMIFAAAVLAIGLHSAPLVEFLMMIGGEAG